jgi:hypothetical protein
MRGLLALLVVSIVLASCSNHEPKPSDPNVIQATGVVQHQDLEGGFFGLVADDGAKYDPGTLPPEFQKDGLRVKFTARKTNAMTTRMWGTTVEVQKIEAVR